MKKRYMMQNEVQSDLGKNQNEHQNILEQDNTKDHLGVLNVSNLDLSESDIDSLIHMYQDEKLAMDIYDVLSDEYDSIIFDKISDAEAKHLSVIENILISNNINIDDLQNLNQGEFVEDDLQNLYNTLLDEGVNSYIDALNVGVQVEEFDIIDLQNLESNTDTNTTLVGIYTNLERGSYNHLNAFESSLS